MLPARIERTTYRLGGDRSILLSYGSALKDTAVIYMAPARVKVYSRPRPGVLITGERKSEEVSAPGKKSGTKKWQSGP